MTPPTLPEVNAIGSPTFLATVPFVIGMLSAASIAIIFFLGTRTGNSTHSQSGGSVPNDQRTVPNRPSSRRAKRSSKPPREKTPAAQRTDQRRARRMNPAPTQSESISHEGEGRHPVEVGQSHRVNSVRYTLLGNKKLSSAFH